MLTLKHNHGSVLEPSTDDGSFLKRLKKAVGIEIDPKICPKNALCMDFFDYPLENQFDTIIGNPPYVKHKDIAPSTKEKLHYSLFDERSNLYLFFIEKAIRHLKPKGELIFITPRDFLKSTSSVKLNEWIYKEGTITHFLNWAIKKFSQTPCLIAWFFVFVRAISVESPTMVCNLCAKKAFCISSTNLTRKN